MLLRSVLVFWHKKQLIFGAGNNCMQSERHMPTSIKDIETYFNLHFTKSVKWGMPINSNSKGVYIVSIGDANVLKPLKDNSLSINIEEMEEWMRNAPKITLYNERPTLEELSLHLSRFWLPDETILYIGKAEKQALSERLRQFYCHKVGKRSPHKGGYWLKLLQNLPELNVHLAYSDNSHLLEEQLLRFFCANVSEKSRMILIDKLNCLPFANLQLRPGIFKTHGLKNHYQ